MPKPFAIKTSGEIADVIRSLHPELKRSVRAALDEMAANPEAGGPLERELGAYRKFRVRRYRFIYSVEKKARVIQIVAFGHRRDIYEEAAAQLKNSKA